MGQTPHPRHVKKQPYFYRKTTVQTSALFLTPLHHQTETAEYGHRYL